MRMRQFLLRLAVTSFLTTGSQAFAQQDSAAAESPELDDSIVIEEVFVTGSLLPEIVPINTFCLFFVNDIPEPSGYLIKSAASWPISSDQIFTGTQPFDGSVHRPSGVTSRACCILSGFSSGFWSILLYPQFQQFGIPSYPGERIS